MIYDIFNKRYVVFESAVSYYLGVAAVPSGYQLHYFRYTDAGQGQIYVQIFLDPLGTVSLSQGGEPAYLALTSASTGGQLTVSSDRVSLRLQMLILYSYPGSDVLSGVPYALTDSMSSVNFIPRFYSATSTVVGGKYGGLPLGYSAIYTTPSSDQLWTALHPVNWYRSLDGVSVSQNTTVADALIYHYCVSRRAMEVPPSEQAYYQNYCTDDNYGPNQGMTKMSDRAQTGGFLYDYSEDTGYCGDPWRQSHLDMIGFSRMVSSTFGRTRDGYCQYDGPMDVFLEMPAPACDPGEVEIFNCSLCTPQNCGGICQNCSSPQCLSQICTADFLEQCSNIEEICSRYATDPCTSQAIGSCSNVEDLCMPYCADPIDPCTSQVIGSCSNVGSICQPYCPECEDCKIPVWMWILVFILGVFSIVAFIMGIVIQSKRADDTKSDDEKKMSAPSLNNSSPVSDAPKKVSSPEQIETRWG